MMIKNVFIPKNPESEMCARRISDEMTFTVIVSSKVDYSVVVKA